MIHNPIDICYSFCGEEIIITYDFAHLNKRSISFNSKSLGKNLNICIQFTNHCYSEKYISGNHPTKWPILLDGGNRKRTFCPIRYHLSKTILISLVNNLNNPKSKVLESSSRRNWVYSFNCMTPYGNYYLFFEIKKASNHSGNDLDITIESAYPMLSPPQTIGKMSFFALCNNVYLGKKTTTRR